MHVSEESGQLSARHGCGGKTRGRESVGFWQTALTPEGRTTGHQVHGVKEELSRLRPRQREL